MLKIFDISGFQGTTAPAGDAVFVKATEGSGYTNSEFAAQYASAKSRAKRRGAYHFARPEQSSAKSQCHRFLDIMQPVPGEVAWLDLEASKLNQADTNRWARDFGDELWTEADWLVTGAYLGRGYVSNNTGRDLSQHFNLWWFPQYPSKYLLRRVRHLAMRACGIHPRSADAPRKVPIARATSLWPPAFAPALPSVNTTGWKLPHAWQFTDNWEGFDASVSWLTINQLASGGGHIQPQEDDVAQVSSLGVDGKQVIAAGATADVKWTKEFTDKHGLHGDGGVSVVIATASYWCTANAIFELHGLTPGAKLDVAWTRVKDDGTYIDDAWRLPYVADASGVIRDEIGGQFGVDSTNRLRLRVYNTSDKPVTVQGAMAKASLLKF